MNMNTRTGFGIAALVLAVIAFFATGAGVWLSMAALVLATLAAARRGYLLALATVLVVLLNTFAIDPTLWSITAGAERAGRDRSVDAIRIFLLILIAAPVIAITVKQMHSKLTEKIMAVFALALLIGFLGVIAWNVPQGPLIAVFAIAVVMAIYDFTRELREMPDTPDKPDVPDS